jgi:hypothetical protein
MTEENKGQDQCTIQNVSISFEDLKKYNIDDIEKYLGTIGYSIIKTEELEDMEERLMNHPC